jgi:hypothetical protein
MQDIVKFVIATSATEEDNTPVNYSDGGRESLPCGPMLTKRLTWRPDNMCVIC